MATEIKVPALGESVTEATVAKWLKKIGDPIAVDDPLVELETDKVTLEVNAASPGILSEIVVPEGTTVEVGSILGRIGESGSKPVAAKPAAAKPHPPKPPPASATPPPPATALAPPPQHP